MARKVVSELRRWLLGEYPRTVGLVGLTTILALALRAHLLVTDIAMLYLVPVVAVAARYRRGAAVLATVLCVACFDLLFVPPYYTFTVDEPAYFLTFGVMFLVALVMSGLTARIREQAEEATARERRTAALYAMSSELNSAENRSQMIAILTRHLAQAARATVTVLLAEDAGLDSDAPRWPAAKVFEDLLVRLNASWTYRSGKSSGQGTAHSAEAEALIVPIRSAGTVLGVAVLSPEPEERLLGADERLTAEALADRAGVDLERMLQSERRAGQGGGRG